MGANNNGRTMEIALVGIGRINIIIGTDCRHIRYAMSYPRISSEALSSPSPDLGPTGQVAAGVVVS